MLITCPECGREVSDQAYMCPGCGFPITAQKTSTRRKRTSGKRKRLPNGFGSITEIKNKRLRNPFYCRVTVGKDAFGKPILSDLKPQAYFPSYEEAFKALCEYNENPYDLKPDITVAQLYDKWTDSYFETLTSDGARRGIKSAWSYCSSIYNMRAKDVRVRHIKGCMDEGTVIITQGKDKGKEKKASPGVKSRIKSMFNLMFDYALEYEIVDTNPARAFEISGDIIKEREEARVDHIVFSEDERKILWDNLYKIDYVDAILIQMYSGWRPQELGLIELENVDLKNWTFTGGMKTDAGRNRTVPIHSLIRPLVEKRYHEAIQSGQPYLICCTDTRSTSKKLTYDKYAVRFKKVMDKLQLDQHHRPHDPRKTFITMAKNAKMDEHVIKAFAGHSDNDVTEKVYTERSIENLISEMEKIKG